MRPLWLEDRSLTRSENILANLMVYDQAFRQVADGTACPKQKELVRLRLEIQLRLSELRGQNQP